MLKELWDFNLNMTNELLAHKKLNKAKMCYFTYGHWWHNNKPLISDGHYSFETIKGQC